ncbi:MAG: Ig-like domain-containing protein [Oscillospiraceae bacterium]|nr:Ig-like domain-containing protein [Oscillospiraceae bacterium]
MKKLVTLAAAIVLATTATSSLFMPASAGGDAAIATAPLYFSLEQTMLDTGLGTYTTDDATGHKAQSLVDMKGLSNSAPGDPTMLYSNATLPKTVDYYRDLNVNGVIDEDEAVAANRKRDHFNTLTLEKGYAAQSIDLGLYAYSGTDPDAKTIATEALQFQVGIKPDSKWAEYNVDFSLINTFGSYAPNYNDPYYKNLINGTNVSSTVKKYTAANTWANVSETTLLTGFAGASQTAVTFNSASKLADPLTGGPQNVELPFATVTDRMKTFGVLHFDIPEGMAPGMYALDIYTDVSYLRHTVDGEPVDESFGFQPFYLEILADCNVTITDKSVNTVEIGGTLDLDAVDTKGHEIVWTSSDPSIATVNADGIVTGVTIGGPVEIIATCADDPSQSDSLTINVTAVNYNARIINLNGQSYEDKSAVALNADGTPANYKVEGEVLDASWAPTGRYYKIVPVTFAVQSDNVSYFSSITTLIKGVEITSGAEFNPTVVLASGAKILDTEVSFGEVNAMNNPYAALNGSTIATTMDGLAGVVGSDQTAPSYGVAQETAFTAEQIKAGIDYLTVYYYVEYDAEAAEKDAEDIKFVVNYDIRTAVNSNVGLPIGYAFPESGAYAADSGTLKGIAPTVVLASEKTVTTTTTTSTTTTTTLATTTKPGDTTTTTVATTTKLGDTTTTTRATVTTTRGGGGGYDPPVYPAVTTKAPTVTTAPPTVTTVETPDEGPVEDGTPVTTPSDGTGGTDDAPPTGDTTGALAALAVIGLAVGAAFTARKKR